MRMSKCVYHTKFDFRIQLPFNGMFQRYELANVMVSFTIRLSYAKLSGIGIHIIAIDSFHSRALTL